MLYELNLKVTIKKKLVRKKKKSWKPTVNFSNFGVPLNDTFFFKVYMKPAKGPELCWFFQNILKDVPNKIMDLDRHVPGPFAEKRPVGEIH